MRNPFLSCLMAFILILGTASAQMQDTGPDHSQFIPHGYATGVQTNPGSSGQVVDVQTVSLPGRPSLRLVFDQVLLGPGDHIEVFSPVTEFNHRLTPAELAKWQNTSAYFNGDTLVVSLYLAAGSTGSYSMSQVIAGLFSMDVTDTICFGVDDRVLSSDPRVARFVSSPTSTGGGCTIWMASPGDCAISAGHCFSGGSLMVAEFNPPLSTSTGSLQHPVPSDQYTIVPSSVQFTASGTGNDWGVCSLNPNNLGQSASANQGWFTMNALIPASGETMRITGHGTASPPEENQVQQTHTGPSAGNTTTALHYTVDTTGGNSGSPVIHEATNTAVGVHTHGGCGANGGSNTGTSFSLGAFMTAYLGACQAAPAAAFTATTTTTVVGNSVQFSDSSSGVPSSWSWDLDGDGNIDSTAQNPSFTYTAAGSFDVTLTVTNSLGSDTLTQPNYITVTQPDTGNPNSAAASLDIAGSLDSSGGIPQPNQNGPFFASLSPGDPLTITTSGPSNQAFLIVAGPLNRNNATIAGVGQLDVGLLGNINDYSDIMVVVDGLNGGSFLDSLANTGPGGSQVFGFTMPILPPGVVTTLQGVVTQPTGLAQLTAATEIVAQ